MFVSSYPEIESCSAAARLACIGGSMGSGRDMVLPLVRAVQGSRQDAVTLSNYHYAYGLKLATGSMATQDEERAARLVP